VFQVLDRDPTLTGRRQLWDAAWGQIYARPMLGTGLDAFWAVAVDWRTLLVLERMGQVGHFHNTYLEVAVQLGGVGLVAALATLAVFCWQALRLALRLETMVDLWPIAFAVAVIVPTIAEYEVFLKHSLTGILLIAIAVAMGRPRRPRDAESSPSQAHPSSPTQGQPMPEVRWPVDQRVRRKADRAEP
jgi:exopolysaccharide production protein ExoQ